MDVTRQHAHSAQRIDPYAAAAAVGGGVAGLTETCCLAKGNRAVSLFERTSFLGGRAATQHGDGDAVDRGLHALCTASGATQLLRGLSVTDRARVPKPVFGRLNRRVYRLPTALTALVAGGPLR